MAFSILAAKDSSMASTFSTHQQHSARRSRSPAARAPREHGAWGLSFLSEKRAMGGLNSALTCSATLSALQLPSSQRVSASAAGFSQTRAQSGFTGYYLDAETGLYYARFRMFSPTLGRFISRDPLGYVDGMSLYNGYFSPNSVDPFGLVDPDEGVEANPKPRPEPVIQPEEKPVNVEEKMAIEESKGKGEIVKDFDKKQNDPNYPPDKFEKRQYIRRNTDGSTVSIHYWREKCSGEEFGHKVADRAAPPRPIPGGPLPGARPRPVLPELPKKVFPKVPPSPELPLPKGGAGATIFFLWAEDIQEVIEERAERVSDGETLLGDLPNLTIMGSGSY